MTQRIKEADYENIYVDCPTGHSNVYNRVTDLMTTEPVSHLENIKCEVKGCDQVYSITGDTAPFVKYRWFFYKRSKLIHDKKYADCILAICQGAEAFFYQAIINKEIDRSPLYRNADDEIDLQSSNTARNDYQLNGRNISEATYKPLRQKFIELYKNDCLQNSFDTSRHLKDDKRQWSFDVIEQSTISDMRNDVVHKYAYRPKKSEVEMHNDLISAITWLCKYLNIRDSLKAVSEPSIN